MPRNTIDARLFHYTTASRFRRIWDSQQINPATANVPSNERAAVWFSFRRTFEPTALPGIRNERGGLPRTATFRELVEIDTPFRIEVDPATAPMDWPTWRETSGVYPATAKSLKLAAKKQQADVNDWRMTFEPVGVEHWLAMEAYIDGRWKGIAVQVDGEGYQQIVVKDQESEVGHAS